MKSKLNIRKDIRVVLLTSVHTRHKWVAEIVNQYLELVCIITENKPVVYSKMMENSKIIYRHFKTNDLFENLYLGETTSLPSVPLLTLPRGDINNNDVVKYVSSKNPDLILLYGTSILKKNWFDVFDGKIINMHSGLSPYYRGSGTNFWPLYYREPEYVGTTIHVASPEVDAGDIICQIRPKIEITDTIYDINMKTLQNGAEKFISSSIYYHEGLKATNQNELYIGYERICKKKDLTEEAILTMFENFNSGMLQNYLKDFKKRTEIVKLISPI